MKMSSQRFVLPAALAALVSGSLGLSADSQKKARPVAQKETRALWITRWDFKTEDDVRRAIRWSASLGFNRVFFQVRGRADAFYRSSLEPWGEELGGSDPGFDPLGVAVDEAARCGIDLDAWVNALPGWKGSESPTSPNHVLHAHPEWFLIDDHGNRHLKNPTDYTILNPCLPEVRAHIVAVVRDIARRYAVHGIQLDYIRFIGRDSDHRTDFPYDPRTLSLFRKYSGAYPTEAPGAWDKFRALAVDALVYRIAEAARAERPGCTVSVAAIEEYDRARGDLFQDVVRWQREGWVDEVYPMTYHRTTPEFAAHLKRPLAEGKAGKVFPGIGAHLHRSSEETVRQVEAARSAGARGYALFAFASLFPSPSHESRSDEASRALRSGLREWLKELNGVSSPTGRPVEASASERRSR